MRRTLQVILIGSTLLGSWLGMQAVHELGHVLGAWATGATVKRVVLHPLTISRTEVANNSRPLVVVWAGPVVGVVVPLLLWQIVMLVRSPGAFLLRFFAGFCLVANGVYIGVGSFGRIGDGGDLLRHGSAPWQLWLFGVIAVPAGFAVWYGQGRHFGFGTSHGQVDPAVAYASLAACQALLGLGLATGR
jgi:hypothetical protein